MLHGWIMEVSFGADDYDISWRLFTTKREGIESVQSQIMDDWEWIRHDFVWGEDLQDYSGLHGLCAFYRTNPPDARPLQCMRLGKHKMYGAFVFCGLLHGEPIPFHTQDQAYGVITWFTDKQESWDAIYTKPSECEAAQSPEAAEANAGPGAPQRATRKVVH